MSPTSPPGERRAESSQRAGRHRDAEARHLEAAFEERVVARTRALTAENAALGRANSEFLSRMSHELRTPLNAILGFAQLLESDDVEADRRAYVREIREGGAQLLGLINELFDVAGLEAGQLSVSRERLDPHQLLTHAPGAPQVPASVLPAAQANVAGTVLYIEDNLANVRLMERIFGKRPGATMLHAARADAGLAMARRHRPDAIFLDLHLPDRGGEDVLREIQGDGELRQIPVAVLSADATAGPINRVLSAGAIAYVTKPIDIGKVLALLDDLLGQSPRGARTENLMHERLRHDLKNHLGTALGFLELILEVTPPTDPRQRDLLEVRDAAQACLALIDQQRPEDTDRATTDQT